MNFREFDTFVFDLDGTIWHWTKLVSGVKETLDKLRKLNKEILFMSNNTLGSRKELVRKLNEFGIRMRSNHLINAGYAIGLFLKERNASAIAFGDGTINDLRDLGVDVRDKPPADYVVICEDWNFNFEKLALAREAAVKGAKLVASNFGNYWFVGDRIVPGVGCWVRAIEHASLKKAECLGKPSDHMVKLASKMLKDPKKTVLFGNEPFSDIDFAKKLGCHAVLIKDDVHRKEKSKNKPDMILNSVKDILKFI